MAEFTTNIQWKGTDLCMDFNCPSCGEFSHFDGMFAHQIQCPHCSAKFNMPSDVGALLVRNDAGTDETGEMPCLLGQAF